MKVPASDLEVYCFLKYNLPLPYRIEAEPSTQYFSEWKYCYRVFDGDCEVDRWSGDYRTLPAGTLVRSAECLLKRIAGEVENLKKQDRGRSRFMGQSK